MKGSVWSVLQHRDGKLHKMSLEAIRAAQKLASLTGSKAQAILLGSSPAEVAAQVADCDLDAVFVVDHPALTEYTPGAYIAALRAAVAASTPSYLVFPHTYQTVDYAPRLAQALDAALVPEVTACESEEGSIVWRRPIMNGKLEARVGTKGDGLVVVSVQASAFPADEVSKGTAPVQKLELDLTSIEPDREILGVEEAAADQVDLTQCDFIVAVGRGIGEPEKISAAQELAAALGAELGASRPVIDNGWLPRERQIGSSGQTVAPKLYIAAGISGAIQHLVGMKGSQVIVAINKDRSAPIFNVAQYGIVGDLHEVLPALTEAVRAVKEG